MEGYVIVRSDGKFVTRPGSHHSYTSDLQKARVWKDKGQAENDRCVENETVRPVSDFLDADQ